MRKIRSDIGDRMPRSKKPIDNKTVNPEAIETAISEAAIAEAVMESAGQKEGDNLKIILYDYSLLRQD